MSTPGNDDHDLPTSLLAEITEIYGDLAAEVDEKQVLETDPQVMAFLARLSLICMTKDRAEMNTVISRLSTAMLWMIMLGREHHARGYAVPLTRTRDEEIIPSYITDMFEED